MHKALHDSLLAAMIEACEASIQRHAGHTFYCVSLYTNSEYSYIVDSLSTIEGLKQAAGRYLAYEAFRERWKTVENAMRELKWSPCDSPYHCEFHEKFSDVTEILDCVWRAVDRSGNDNIRTLRMIHDTSVSVLGMVREYKLFNECDVVFNVLMGDQANEERILNAEEINSKEVVERLRSELIIDETALELMRKIRWKG